jgi:hypothetical protein
MLIFCFQLDEENLALPWAGYKKISEDAGPMQDHLRTNSGLSEKTEIGVGIN